MEAVPKLPMLSFELKLSHEASQFGIPIKNYIRSHYFEDGESYANEIKEIETLRMSACKVARDFTGCSTLKRYFSQLHLLQSRFPMTQDAEASVYFVWTDIFSGIEYSYTDIKSEQACILYNIGALHSELGAVDNRHSSEGMKVSCTHFQCAAWAFQHLRDEYPQPKGSDTSYELLSFYISVMLAQAQECILEKSMQDNRKSAIVSKVSIQICDYYRQSQKILDSSSKTDDDFTAIVDIVGKQFKLWKKFIDFKISYYKAISLLYQGNQAEEQQKMGERLAYYQGAADTLSSTTKLSKGIDEGEIKEAISFTMDVITAKLTAAKKENDFIYHEKVPELNTLTELKGASLVKGIPFDPSDPEISGPDIFNRLVPIEAHETSSLYSEEKAKLLRKVTEKIEEKDKNLALFLSSLQLEQLSLFDDASQNTIPQELIEKCAALSARPNAISDLVSAMQGLSGICTDVDSDLKEIKRNMIDEDAKEKEYQNIVGKRAPSNLLLELKKELNKYEEAHERASESNSTLHKALSIHIRNLKELGLSLPELQNSLPSIDSDANVNKSSLFDMKRLLSKIDEMKQQRMMFETQLRDQMQNDDITKRVMAAGKNVDIQILFSQELKKYDNQIALLEQNMNAQENILLALTDANAKFANTRKMTVDIMHKRNSKIQSLFASYDAYEDLLEKTQKGSEFYKKLQGNVNKLLNRIKGVCRVQEEERLQLIGCNQVKVSKVDNAPKLKDYLARGNKLNTQLPVDKITKNPAMGMRPSPVGAELTPSTYCSPQSSSNQHPTSYISNASSVSPSVYTSNSNVHIPSSVVNQIPPIRQIPSSNQSFVATTYSNVNYNYPPHGYSTNAVPPVIDTFPRKVLNNGNQYDQSSKPVIQNQQFRYQCPEQNLPKSSLGNSNFQRFQPVSSHADGKEVNINYSPQHQLYSGNVAQNFNQESQFPNNIPAHQTSVAYAPPPNQTLSQYNSNSSIDKPVQQSVNRLDTSNQYFQATQNIPVSTPSFQSSLGSAQNYQGVTASVSQNNYPTPSLPSSQNNYSTPSLPNSQNQIQTYQNNLNSVSQQNFSTIPSAVVTYASSDPSSGIQQSYSNFTATSHPTVSPVHTLQHPANMGQNLYSQTAKSLPGNTLPSQIQQPPSHYQSQFHQSYSHMSPSISQGMCVNQTTPVMNVSQNSGHPQPPIQFSQQSHSSYNPSLYPEQVSVNHSQQSMSQISTSQAAIYQHSNIQNPINQPMASFQANQVFAEQQVSQPFTQQNMNEPVVQQKPSQSLHHNLLQPLQPEVCHIVKPLELVDKTNNSNDDVNQKLSSSENRASTFTPVNKSSDDKHSKIDEEKNVLKSLNLDNSKKSVTSEVSDTPVNKVSNLEEIRMQKDELERSSSPKDPYTDVELLNKFTSEVKRYEKFVEGLTKPSLMGQTPLNQKWEELCMTQDKESRKLSISIARCYPIKNRNQDIMPYDQTRVEIKSLKDDYINASYITELSETSPRYIVTQAPLPVTFTDFWTMVWEQQTEVIICLLSDSELKGHVYWPNDRGQLNNHGSVKLSLQSIKSKPYCVERMINITHHESNISRVVIHLQLTCWPSSGLPESPIHILQFISDLHFYHRQQRSLLRPIVVHCSDGSGRSGILCLLSAAVQDINCGRGIIDTLVTIIKMCLQRKYIIYDKEQLRFCYEAVLYHARDLLLKRGILTNQSSFESKPSSDHNRHVRHPSQDFILGSGNLATMQSKLGLDVSTSSNVPNEQHLEGDKNKISGDQGDKSMASQNSELDSQLSMPSDSIESSDVNVQEPKLESTESHKESKNNELTSLLDPNTFNLDGCSIALSKKKITKEDFSSPSKGSLKDLNVNDPLSMLDPLWSVKK